MRNAFASCLFCMEWRSVLQYMCLDLNLKYLHAIYSNALYCSGDEYAVPDKGRGLSSNGHIYENEANDQPEYTYVANSNCIK